MKRPWQIDILADDDVTQYKSVTKSRAMGLSEITPSDFTKVLADVPEAHYKDTLEELKRIEQHHRRINPKNC
ncbi:hypothetical protein [Bacillus thuringiensis]|uniref:hypothetical protein n=1 Tax=Bacillus thuringiensis TaxID=1428 RepID=UPI000A37F80C|nr:hypothetical protein [Bacillus thuringiensis]OTZ48001.1 hypothetical protein BK762_20175 [Bacillus thuringiensis serovar toumanoffi]